MTRQFELDFEGGLTQRYPTFREALHASVYQCPRQLKAVAADLDMTSSELSRRLAGNPEDTVHFPAYRVPELISATGNLLPVFWLVEKLCEDPEARKRHAVAKLSELMPLLQAVLAEATR